MTGGVRRTSAGAGAAVGAVTALLVLASCGSDDAPDDVVDVRWQVTAVGDAGTAVTTQARTFLAVGADTFTGAVGCERFTGTVDWKGSGNDATVTFSDTDTRTEGDCAPGDAHLAEQITDLFGTPDLRWRFDDSNALREFRLWVDGSPENGVTFSG